MSTYSINKDDLILCLVALIFPTIPVIMRKGFWTKETLLNFLLLILFAFPAALHAWYVIYKTSSLRGDEEYDRLQNTLESGFASDEEEQSHQQHEQDQHNNAAPPSYVNVTRNDNNDNKNHNGFPLDNKVQH
ncbi:hypothetical protein ACO0QE_001360 [Hanseniaspora vineae]